VDNWQSVGKLPNFFSASHPAADRHQPPAGAADPAPAARRRRLCKQTAADPAPAARRLCKKTARRSGASRPPPSATDKEAGMFEIPHQITKFIYKFGGVVVSAGDF